MKRTTLDWARVDKSDLLGNAELSRKLAALEKKYDAQFKVVFDTIRELMAPALRVGAEQPGVRDRAHGHAIWVRTATSSCGDQCGMPSCSCISDICPSSSPAGQGCSPAGDPCNVISGPSFIEYTCE